MIIFIYPIYFKEWNKHKSIIRQNTKAAILDPGSRDRLSTHCDLRQSFFNFFPTRIPTNPASQSQSRYYCPAFCLRIGQSLLYPPTVHALPANQRLGVAICRNKGGFNTTPAAIPEGDFPTQGIPNHTNINYCVIIVMFYLCDKPKQNISYGFD